MKIQTKMLKKLIAILCAATMVASGAAASVGAIDDKEISQAREAATACKEKVKELEKQKKEEKAKRDNDKTIQALKRTYGKYKRAIENGQSGKKLSKQQIGNLYSLNKDLKDAELKLDKACQKYDKIINKLDKAINKAKKEENELNKLVEELIKQAEEEKLEKERQQKLEQERLEKEKKEKEKQEQNKNQNENKEEMKKSDDLFSNVDVTIINTSNAFKSFGNFDNGSVKKSQTDIKSGVLVSFAPKDEESKPEVDKELEKEENKSNESINNLSENVIIDDENSLIHNIKLGNSQVSSSNNVELKYECEEDNDKFTENYDFDYECAELGRMIKLSQGIDINSLKSSVVESQQDSNNVNNKAKKEAAENLGSILNNIAGAHGKQAAWNAIDRMVKEKKDKEDKLKKLTECLKEIERRKKLLEKKIKEKREKKKKIEALGLRLEKLEKEKKEILEKEKKEILEKEEKLRKVNEDLRNLEIEKEEREKQQKLEKEKQERLEREARERFEKIKLEEERLRKEVAERKEKEKQISSKLNFTKMRKTLREKQLMFLKWKNSVEVADKYNKDLNAIRDKVLLCLGLEKQADNVLSDENVEKFIKESTECMDMMYKFKNKYEAAKHEQKKESLKRQNSLFLDFLHCLLGEESRRLKLVTQDYNNQKQTNNITIKIYNEACLALNEARKQYEEGRNICDDAKQLLGNEGLDEDIKNKYNELNKNYTEIKEKCDSIKKDCEDREDKLKKLKEERESLEKHIAKIKNDIKEMENNLYK